LIWIATDQGGLDLLDRAKLTVRNLHHSDEERSIAENAITTLYKDNTGTIWVEPLKRASAIISITCCVSPCTNVQPGQAREPASMCDCFAEGETQHVMLIIADALFKGSYPDRTRIVLYRVVMAFSAMLLSSSEWCRFLTVSFACPANPVRPGRWHPDQSLVILRNITYDIAA